ncbi:hypothetical protein [Cyanobium sp. CH-040]|uniref:hypothetical protein n=1 Tax=Cyanobium sp. CH-040 TaxID=2823708 RepID=UPI0020CD49AB|nr:hypothetical protein [Cyanobium sp. CH-040]MCP9927706.1 hypothetical protein [Cyanobium sp. CH-040]
MGNHTDHGHPHLAGCRTAWRLEKQLDACIRMAQATDIAQATDAADRPRMIALEHSRSITMLIRLYRSFALASAALWSGTGFVVIGSIAMSVRNWVVNLVMGQLFVIAGLFLCLRANQFACYYMSIPCDMQRNPACMRFLRLDFLLVLITCLVGGLLFAASLSRVVGEGYAVFG